MAARVVGCFLKVVAVVFTSIAAPILVNLAIRSIRVDVNPSPGRRSEPLPNSTIYPVKIATKPGRASAWAESGEVIQVIAQGVGKTPTEAWQDALRSALSQALAAQVDGQTLAQRGPSLIEELSRNNAGLLRGWQELGASREWKLRGIVHHKEVAVEVNRPALLERLRAAHVIPD